MIFYGITCFTIFLDALAKIVFHTGIVACQVYDLLSKTLCQLVIVKDEASSFAWFLVFDQEPLKGNVRTGDVVDTSGVNFRMKSRIGEEFLVTVPITGEKARVLPYCTHLLVPWGLRFRYFGVELP